MPGLLEESFAQDDLAIRRAASTMADMLSSALMPRDGTWAGARPPYVWEHNALCWLESMGERRGPINAWTAMLLREGYPAAKAGADQGRFWKPGAAPRWEDEQLDELQMEGTFDDNWFNTPEGP